MSTCANSSFEPTFSSGATSSLSPGMLIGGRYRLEQLLGRGGQGSVWRAHHLTLGVPVALKLTSLSCADEQNAARLLQEARAAARLSHPAVVRVFDLGCHDGSEPFVVMELLEGQSLARKLEKERRLSTVATLRLLLPIADALRAAHDLGFVHRDVKPQNIFLANHEGSLRNPHRDCCYPKLLDFGVVKVADDTARRASITRAGVAVGSPLYLSPEQALCGEVDPRADVWGFCATVYECITGEHPFRGSTYIEVVRAILESEPRSLSDHGIEDGELWRILLKGLAKAPEERWCSMAELGAALANLLARRGVREDAAGRSLDAAWPLRASVQGCARATKRAAPKAAPPPASGVRTKPPRVELIGAAIAGLVLSGVLALLGVLPREMAAEAAPKAPAPAAVASPAEPTPGTQAAPTVQAAQQAKAAPNAQPVVTPLPDPPAPAIVTSIPLAPKAASLRESAPPPATAGQPETPKPSERTQRRTTAASGREQSPGAARFQEEPELLEAY